MEVIPVYFLDFSKKSNKCKLHILLHDYTQIIKVTMDKFQTKTMMVIPPFTIHLCCPLHFFSSSHLRSSCVINFVIYTYMSHFSYACKTEGENGISRLISTLCVNCLSYIPEYSRIIDYSIIWMCIWCGLLQKLHKIKKSELLNSKVSFKL